MEYYYCSRWIKVSQKEYLILESHFCSSQFYNPISSLKKFRHAVKKSRDKVESHAHNNNHKVSISKLNSISPDPMIPAVSCSRARGPRSRCGRTRGGSSRGCSWWGRAWRGSGAAPGCWTRSQPPPPAARMSPAIRNDENKIISYHHCQNVSIFVIRSHTFSSLKSLWSLSSLTCDIP